MEAQPLVVVARPTGVKCVGFCVELCFELGTRLQKGKINETITSGDWSGRGDHGRMVRGAGAGTERAS
jgi:hypothetical protein